MNFANVRRWCRDHDVEILLVVIIVMTLIGGFCAGWTHRGRVDTLRQTQKAGNVVTAAEPSSLKADLSKDQQVAVNRLLKAGYVVRVRVDLDDKTAKVFVSGSVTADCLKSTLTINWLLGLNQSKIEYIQT